MTEKPGYWYRQSGVIALRGKGAGTEVLLVTSRKGRRWVIPKGIVEQEMSAAESALREAWEEAGVRGSLRPSAPGCYFYRKWGKTCSVAVFVLDVEETHDSWPEGRIRQRQWFPPWEAASKVEEEDLRNLIISAARPPDSHGE